jgi:transcriptional regulator GlxA family with amidase domain
MTFTFKRRSTASEPNARKVESLCAWIQENSNQPLGWSQLTKQSGFTKEQLVEFFHIYKQTTPLAFVRKVRQQKSRAKKIKCLFLTTSGWTQTKAIFSLNFYLSL